MSIYFVAGEASGDTHGAALMRALHSLDQSLHFIGRGGPQMRAAAGGEFIDWSEHSAVLGLWEVLRQYGYFRREFAATLREIEESKPAAVVLIDYPGFNLRLAYALRKRGATSKIIYYISPQVWAWNRGRIPKMARDLDLMLCIFPFEAELYNKSGLRTIFVGHPIIDSLGNSELKADEKRDRQLIALLPGSRAREVRKILPIMMNAAEIIAKQKSAMSFDIVAPSQQLADEIRKMTAVWSCQHDVRVGDAKLLMHRACVGIVASGTATLESARLRMPFVLVYRVAWLTYLAARLVVKVKFLGMPNVLLNREVVPEFIQHKAQPDAIAAEVLRLIDDKEHRHKMLAAFDEIIDLLGHGGASEAAARAILQELAA